VVNSVFSVVGCCPDVSSNKCPIPTTCFDYTQSASYTSTNKNDLYCSETAYPSCLIHSYASDDNGGFSGYTLWDCATNAGRTDTVYYLPSKSTTSSSASSPTTSSDTTSQSTPTTLAGTITPVTSTDGAVASVTGTAGTGSNDPPEPKKKSSHTGAIVGGVVGGVAGLAILGVGLWFLLRKKKQPAAAPTAAPTTNAAVAPGAGTPGAPAFADPNYPTQPGQPQMAQQQPQGQYGYPNPALAQAGLVPAGAYDQRNSVAESWHPHNANANAYDPNQQQQQFTSPPASPAPTSQGQPGSPPPGGYAPSPASGYAPNPGYSNQGQGQQYNGQQAPGAGYPHSPQQGHPSQFISELPAHRGDGQLNELA
jgi:hypothetical protein